MNPSRYSRQITLKQIGESGQARLAKSRAVIVGLGALGSVSANLLARAGVGNLTLIDRDFLELNNLQRQVLYNEEDLAANLPKAVAAKRTLQKVNAEIQIRAEVSDLNPQTAESLLSGADVIVDGTDNFETRFLINDFALQNKIPWVYGGAVVTEGMTYVILPGQRPCLRCVFPQPPSADQTQTCDRNGILAPVSHMVASLQTMEALKILLGKSSETDPRLWRMDFWNREWKTLEIADATLRCEGCEKGDYPYLNRQAGSRTVRLCGRGAVQIAHSQNTPVDLPRLAEKLSPEGDVRVNEYLLKYSTSDFEITVFSNGRAIVKGTEDEAQARSWYAKYIGA